MAKRKKIDANSIQKQELVTAFNFIEDAGRSFKKDAHLEVKQSVTDTLIETIKRQLKKDYDPDVEARVIINSERGDFEVYLMKEVVKEVDIPLIHISLDKAKEIDEDIELGDIYEEGPVKLDQILSRKSIQIIKQSVQKKVRDYEWHQVYQECKQLEGEIVTGIYYQSFPKEVIFTYNTSRDSEIELILPASEKMNRDRFSSRTPYKLYVKSVERPLMKVVLKDGTEVEKEREDGRVNVIVSRTDNRLLFKLFEAECPEIADGLIIIKSIARVPGERAKISVEPTVGKIDPVGACVGHRGSRIKGIVKELNNENIDVIPFSDELQVYIARALQPAKVDPMDIAVDYKEKKARVIVKSEQIKFAIGRHGNNIFLAEKLTGFDIEIVRYLDKHIEDSNDIDVLMFREDFGDDIVYRLIDGGMDTAMKIEKSSPKELRDVLLNVKERTTLAFPIGSRRPQRVISDEDKAYWEKIGIEIKQVVAQELSAHFDDSKEKSEDQIKSEITDNSQVEPSDHQENDSRFLEEDEEEYSTDNKNNDGDNTSEEKQEHNQIEKNVKAIDKEGVSSSNLERKVIEESESDKSNEQQDANNDPAIKDKDDSNTHHNS